MANIKNIATKMHAEIAKIREKQDLELMKSIGTYVDIWRDGDSAEHSIGHILNLIRKYNANDF